jgi:hypothetical protein
MTGLETRFTRRLRRPWTAPRGVAESSCSGKKFALAIGPIMRVSVHSPHVTTPPSGGEACHV